MAQAEDEEEPAFLNLAHVCLEAQPVAELEPGETSTLGIRRSVSEPPLTASAQPAAALLHLDEPCAHAFLGSGSSDDKFEGWYLDSDATHHMASRAEHFTDLDHGVRSSVKFGDASSVEIRDVGSVILMTKTGDHKVLRGFFFIPTLWNSIIILGQLDEGGAKVDIDHGVL